MCRLAAFPPNFPREKAFNIIRNFYETNEDGTGSVYMKDGKFVTHRYNFSFRKVWKNKLPLIDHMPYPGWTIVHVRAASHGRNTLNNTHPFIKGDCALVHNGVFREFAPVKAALSANYKFKGETDSEVAAVLWKTLGKKKFMKAVDSGVYLVLNRNGRVDAVCNTGGDLVFQKTKYGVVMASELPDTFKRKQTVLEGHFKLGKNGKIVRSKWEKDDAAGWNWYDSEYADYTFPGKGKKKKNKKCSKVCDDEDMSKFKKDAFDESDTDTDEWIDTQVSNRGYLWL